MKSFHIGDVLSIVTGRLVSLKGAVGLSEILSYMTSENLLPFALPRAIEECKPYLLEQYPQLKSIRPEEMFKNIPIEEITFSMVKEWLNTQIELFGEYYDVDKLPAGIHIRIDPRVETWIWLNGKF